MKRNSFYLANGVFTLLVLGLVLAACGDSTPTAPAATTAAPTTAATTSAPTTTAPTTVAPTTAATTTAPTTAPATTVAPTTAPATTAATADWTKELPKYPNIETLELDNTLLAGFGIPAGDRFAVNAGISADSPAKVATFYIEKLKPTGWEVAQSVPLGKEDDGTQLNFTRQANQQIQRLIVVIAANNAFTTIPSLKPFAAKVTSGRTLVLTVADRQGQAASDMNRDLAKNEQEVTFPSGQDKIAGTLLVPTATSKKMPGVIIIAGSGPTDRNGNNTLVKEKIDNLQNMARQLGDAGVVSLRYDKVGTGKTGAGSFASNPSAIDFDVYVRTARSAYDYLKARPEVDPTKMYIIGHSEGGLITLLVADQLKGTPDAPAGLVLAAPLSRPYLQTLRRQLFAQYDQAAQLKQYSQEQVDKAKTALDELIKSLEQTGKYPEKFDLVFPAVQQIFNPSNEKFLGQAAKYDPAQIAAGLPTKLPVLIVHGAGDVQVSTDDVQYLYAGFQKAGNSNASLKEIAGLNHVLNVIAETTPDGPKFSPEVADLLKGFVR